MKLNNKKTLTLLVLIVGIVFLYQAIFTMSWTAGPNYENVTVDTRVNITDAPPTILYVTIDENQNGVSTITLAAGTTRVVSCNATIRDWNGFDDIFSTNGTLWDNTNTNMEGVLDNNTLYRNSSCSKIGDDGNYISYWQCSFDVYYYANNGSDWRCNMTAVDNSNYKASNYNITEFSALYALNITADGTNPQQIDYGNVAVETYSVNRTVNITNFGNLGINVSVWGFAFEANDGLAFNCTINSNITIGNERYTINSSQNWNDKVNLTPTSQQIGNLTVTKQTVPGTYVTNQTYWEIYVPVEGGEAPAGECTGSVVFEASSS
ncbi:MAG: hypothetical protein ABH828_03480 [archaeon]